MSFKLNPITGKLDLVRGITITTWKSPVANAAALPTVSNTDADVRVTIDTDEVWAWDAAGSRWENQQIKASAAIGSTPNAAGYSIAVNETVADLRTNEIVLQPADSSNPGIVTTAAQNFSGSKTFDNNLIVTGNLTVNGSTTELSTTTTNIEDPNVTYNRGGSDATSEGAGITIERTATDGSIVYEDALAAKFKAGPVGSEIELANISSTQTITNKSIDADSNTITNIKNADIKVAAAIDAAKINTGAVSNTEFNYLDGVTSSIQTQINSKADQNLNNLTSPTSINQHLFPDGDLTRLMGSNSLKWASIIAGTQRATVKFRIENPALQTRGDILPDDTTPAGTSVDVSLSAIQDAGNLAIYTAEDSSGSAVGGGLFFETGPKTTGSGDSGPITLQTGTSFGGIRGEIVLDGLSVNASTSKITNVVDPTAAQDAATKNYIDSNFANTALSNLDATTSINASLLPNGSLGLGSANDHWNLIYGNLYISRVAAPYFGGDFNRNTAPTFQSGHISGATNSGPVTVQSGDQLGGGTGTLADLNLKSGENFNAANANPTGDVNIKTGPTAGAGARGTINLLDGSEGTPGNVWTEGAVAGEGSWAAAAAAGDAWGDAVDANIIPDGVGNRNLGSAANHFGSSYHRFLQICEGGVAKGQLQAIGTSPGGTSFALGIRPVSSGDPIGFYGLNTSVSGDIFLETGNVTSGANPSGDVRLRTGTIFSGTRGDIDMIAGTIKHNQTTSTAVVWENGATGSRPVSPVTGQRFFDTTLGQPVWYDGTNWVDAQGTTV